MLETEKKPKRRLIKSISQRTLILVLAIAVVLGVTAIVIGYTVYSSTMDAHILSNTVHLANTTSSLVDRDIIEHYGTRIFRLYNETTEIQRENQDEEEYRALFDGIETEDNYQQTREVLSKIREKNDIQYAYIMVIDPKTNICLYVADGDTNPETYCAPGVWEPIEPEQVVSLKSGKAVISHEEFGWLSSSASMIYEGDDGTFCVAIIDISMNDVMEDRAIFLRNYCIALLLVIAVLSLLMTWNMRNQVVVPINKLAKAAGDYSYDRAHHDAEHPTSRNHFSKLNIRTGDELENLSAVMADMETQLGEYIDNLTRVTAEKERIGAELNIATQIQADMLPRIFPAFPDRTEFDIYANMTPAKEVGGDFYDFFLIDDNHLGLVMADVSGKGVPAALFMVIAKTLIKNRAQMGGGPGEILKYVNEQLCEGNDAELFVTVWFAILDISTGKGLAANAGHEHPAIRRAGGNYELSIYRHSPAVATVDGIRFREHEFELHPGDSLFVYTDGVAEATDAHDELFGPDRMLEALNEKPDAKPEELLHIVRRHIDDFVGSAPQFDDITMMNLHYMGPEGENNG